MGVAEGLVHMAEPLVKLDGSGKAAVISYNIPEPTSYSGRHFIDLPYPAAAFVTIMPSDTDDTVRGGEGDDQSRRALRRVATAPTRVGSEADHILPAGVILTAENQDGPAVGRSDRVLSTRLASLTQADLARAAAAGRRLAIYEDISGQMNYRFLQAKRIPTLEPADPWDIPPAEEEPESPAFPFVRIMLDGDGAVSLSGPAAGVKFTVAGTYVSELAFVETLTISVNGGTASKFDPVDGSTWSYDLTLTTAGSHVITVGITSRDRRVGYSREYKDSVSLTVNVTLDATPAPAVQLPTVSVSSPANPTTVVDPTGVVTLQVAGKASAIAPATLKSIEIRDELTGKTVQIGGVDGKQSHDWTAQLLLDKPGSHRITVTVLDSNGNAPPSPAAVTVRLFTSAKFRRLKSRLMLVETLNLSSFLGNFGAGRVVKTFSLLPGEKTTISVKTWTKTAEEQKSASSILDSSATESADNFEDTLAAEQSNKEAETEAFAYKVSASAGASWGWGSASINAEASGSANSAREEAVKNVSTATRKHALKASSNRTVSVNTEYKSSSEEGSEESTVREVANVNVSRTLNFVFRQMNQEFITLVHLTNVRVAFYTEDLMLDENGEPAYKRDDKTGKDLLDIRSSYREVPLSELDKLLVESVNPAYHNKVREAILNAMSGIPDWKDNLQTVFEEVKPKKDGAEVPGAAYVRFKRHLTQTFSDPGSTFTIEVPGVIVSYDKIVMRTEGVLVDTILGGGNGLDRYSTELQDVAVEERRVAIAEKQAEVDRQELARKIVADGDKAAAAIFAQLFPPPVLPATQDHSP